MSATVIVVKVVKVVAAEGAKVVAAEGAKVAAVGAKVGVEMGSKIFGFFTGADILISAGKLIYGEVKKRSKTKEFEERRQKIISNLIVEIEVGCEDKIRLYFENSSNFINIINIKNLVDSLQNYFNFYEIARKSLKENNNLSFLEGCNSTKHFNIILIGKTGAGKSTLINAVLCLEKEKEAKTGFFDCTTMENSAYDGKGIRLIDTRGIEIGEYGVDEVIENVRKLIKEGSEGNDPDKYIHCIWYCFSGNRLEKNEINIIEKIKDSYEDKSLPVILVYTQASSDESREQMKNAFQNKFGDKYQYCEVLAKKKDEKGPFGINKLIKETSEKLEEAIESAFHRSLILNIKKRIHTEISSKKNVCLSDPPTVSSFSELPQKCKDALEDAFKNMESVEKINLSDNVRNILDEYSNGISITFELKFNEFFRNYLREVTKDFANFIHDIQSKIERGNDFTVNENITTEDWIKHFSDEMDKEFRSKLSEVFIKKLISSLSRSFVDELSERFIKSYDKVIETEKDLLKEIIKKLMKDINKDLLAQCCQDFQR